jgi:hypothetical protein
MWKERNEKHFCNALFVQAAEGLKGRRILVTHTQLDWAIEFLFQ